MPSSAGTLQQINVRLDADLKRRAEGVLSLMGSSATDLIRSAYEKVARGAGDYTEAMEVLKGPKPTGAQLLDTLRGGWSLSEGLYRSVGIDPPCLTVENRSWDEVYEDAMAAHFEEKGLLQ
ncbi:MAG: hypothetical protein IJH08_06725 [Atopobiaceae bacterium]|nr:hypothetical protein [Atopobiaceae bacterium]